MWLKENENSQIFFSMNGKWEQDIAVLTTFVRALIVVAYHEVRYVARVVIHATFVNVRTTGVSMWGDFYKHFVTVGT